MSDLRAGAEQILRDNDRQRYTIPSGHLYPHQWAWDSGFAAIGWGHLDLERACTEIDTLLAGQWDDGRVPHIQFHTHSPNYFPGPDSWGKLSSSTITNPPVWTLAAERLYQLGAEPDRVKGWLERFDRSHQFLHSARDPLGWHCIATAHPWENGQDNSPAWDEPLEAVDPEEAPPFKRVDTTRVEDPAQRPTDLQYKRYMTLVHRFKNNGFKMANFAVYDPFFTTLTALAEESLARLSEDLGWTTEAGLRAERLRTGLARHLWSDDLGRYRYYDARAERYGETYTSGSLAPVLLGQEIEGYQRMLATLQNEFAAEHGLPTVCPKSPDFDPVCYWRGPSWVNMNWFFGRALGRPLIESTLRTVEKSGFWEYFDPLTGKGLGTDRFTWTAALVLDLLPEVE